MRRNLNITYGCYPSFFSTLIANMLIWKGLDISCLLISTKKLTIERKQIDGLKGLLFIFRRFTAKFIAYHLCLALFVPIIFKWLLAFKGQKFYSIKRLCAKNNIKYIESDDFNRDVDKIYGTDIFLSMCLDQIINKQFISKISNICINIHPSDLPNFRGVESIIPFLLSPEKRMGITMHQMTPEIDAGCFIAKKYVDRNNKSYFELMNVFVVQGVEMFSEYIKNDLKHTAGDLNITNTVYPYQSWPTKENLVRFQKNNKYIKLADLWNLDNISESWHHKC